MVFIHVPACTGGHKRISIPSGDIVPVTLHFGQHLDINPDTNLMTRPNYYEDCTWIINPVGTVTGYTIRILNITLLRDEMYPLPLIQPRTLRDTNTLLLLGYGHTPYDGLSRIYDASTAKPLTWFALNTSEFWIRFEQIEDGPGVEFEIESHGNHFKYQFAYILNVLDKS